jgi:hypothetical protein
VNRPFDCFSSRARSARPPDKSTLRLEGWKAWFAHYVLWIILGSISAGIFLFAGGITFLWGQTDTSGEAVQTASDINLQYEYNVKAAYLYSFGRYVVWPPDAFSGPTSPFIIGVCGEDPFGQVLDRIAEVKTIQGRRIVIRNMSSIEDLQPCHILFVSRSIPLEKQEVVIRKMRGKAVLLVGEVPGFVRLGGGINFFLDAGTVQFEINVDAIQQEKLILDAKLMSLGKKAPDATVQ